MSKIAVIFSTIALIFSIISFIKTTSRNHQHVRIINAPQIEVKAPDCNSPNGKKGDRLYGFKKSYTTEDTCGIPNVDHPNSKFIYTRWILVNTGWHILPASFGYDIMGYCAYCIGKDDQKREFENYYNYEKSKEVIYDSVKKQKRPKGMDKWLEYIGLSQIAPNS